MGLQRLAIALTCVVLLAGSFAAGFSFLQHESSNEPKTASAQPSASKKTLLAKSTKEDNSKKSQDESKKAAQQAPSTKATGAIPAVIATVCALIALRSGSGMTVPSGSGESFFAGFFRSRRVVRAPIPARITRNMNATVEFIRFLFTAAVKAQLAAGGVE